MLTFPSSTASSAIRAVRFLHSISFDMSTLGRERRCRRLVLRSLILDSGVGVSGRELKRRNNCTLNSIKQNIREHTLMTSSNGSIFRVTGPLGGKLTGHRWIPLKKANVAELWCFLLSMPEQTVQKTIETLMIWDAIALIMTSMQWNRAEILLLTLQNFKMFDSLKYR